MPFMRRPRLLRIRELYGRDLVAAAQGGVDESAEGIEQILRKFAEADPTSNKSATQWLVRTFLGKGFRIEDLGKATDTLIAFARHRSRLPDHERDLGRYRSLAELWKAIKPFAESHVEEEPAGRAARRRERDQARQESIILHEGNDGFIVAVPLTERASCWWGRGTRWCTAAEKANAFSYYHELSPLIVIILPDGQKLQLCAFETDVQFMDADDSAVSPEFISRWWGHLAPVISWAMTQSEEALDLVPESLRDRGVCLEAVRKRGNALKHVPQELRDREICWNAVSRSGSALSHVPMEQHDRAICLEAVRQDPHSLSLVDQTLRDSELCQEVARHGRDALANVPKGWINRSMALDAVRADGRSLIYVPEPVRDRDVCLAAVMQNGNALRFVPSDIEDRDIYLAAVRKNGTCLKMVPEAKRDREICLAAIQSTGAALSEVPEELRDRDTCLQAVRRTGGALVDVPAALRDRQMCLEAVARQGQSLQYVPEEQLDRSMALMAVQNDGFALIHVPEELQDRDLCLSAVRQKGRALRFASQWALDDALCMEAVKQTGMALQFVPHGLLSREICIEAIRQVLIEPISSANRAGYDFVESISTIRKVLENATDEIRGEMNDILKRIALPKAWEEDRLTSLRSGLEASSIELDCSLPGYSL